MLNQFHTTCTKYSNIFVPIKTHVLPVKKQIRIIFCKYAHVHSLSTWTIKLHEMLLSSFRGVVLTNFFSCIFYFSQISKFKRGIIPPKKWNENFLWICASTQYVLHNYKVSTKLCWAVSEELGWQKTPRGLMDWLTDKQVKNINSIPSTTRCMGYNKFYKQNLVNHSLLYSFHCMHLKKKIFRYCMFGSFTKEKVCKFFI